MASEGQELCLVVMLCYLAVVFFMIIGVSSWMININNSERWRDMYGSILEGDAANIAAAFNSWNSKPYVDIVATSYSCPSGYDEVLYDIWPGTRGHCDCLQRERERNIIMDRLCHRGKNGSEND